MNKAPSGPYTSTRGSRSARARQSRHHRGLGAVAAGLMLCGSGLLATSGVSAGQTEPSGVVNVVGYSVVGPAYTALETAFQKTPEGANVTFTNTFGSSGTESRAVVAGLPADVVNFSLTTDMERLVSKHLVASTWNANSITHGMVTNSVVVFAVPKGNPEHIKTWADLVKPGVRIFTPNPFSSGSARWNIMAAFGAEKELGHTSTAQRNYVNELLAHTVTQSSNAADELDAFLVDRTTHKNDVLLDYEDDIIGAIHAGEGISYVIPPQDLLIENPIAVTSNSKNPVAANAFVTYLLSNAGQELWASLGYRPVRPKLITGKLRKVFPDPKQVFTIQYLGGWDNIATEYFAVPNGVVTAIEASLGQSTASS